MTRQLSVLALSMLAAAACGDDTSSGTGGGGGAATTSATQATTTAQTTGTGGAAPGTHCEEACAYFAGVIDRLACGAEPNCVADCEMAYAGINQACVDEAEAFDDCLILEPDSSFQCSPGTGVTVNAGVCQTELDALIACGP